MVDKIMNEIVTRIYELLAKSGISKVSLADKIGVSRNTIQYWKKADAYPSLHIIEKICEVFGITSEQFFSGMGKVDNKSEQEFLDSWRMLTDAEKAVVVKVISVFKEDKAVQND